MAPLRKAHPTQHPGRAQLRHAATPLKQATPAAGQNQPKPAAPAAQPAPNQYDYSADPILQRVQAWVNQQNANAEAQAVALRNQAMIAFNGQNNPFSTLANLARNHTQNVTNLNENLNKANLFYSGARGKALNQEQTNYLGQQYSANQAYQNQLTGINQNLLNAETANQNQLIGAQQDAYQRAVDYAMKYGGPAGAKTTTGLRRAIPSSRPSRTALLRNFQP